MFLPPLPHLFQSTLQSISIPISPCAISGISLRMDQARYVDLYPNTLIMTVFSSSVPLVA